MNAYLLGELERRRSEEKDKKTIYVGGSGGIGDKVH